MRSSQRSSTRKKEQNDDDKESDDDDSSAFDTEQDTRDEYTKEDSSSEDEVKMPKRRVRKKGRRAKFLVQQMIMDQQMQTMNPLYQSFPGQLQNTNYQVYVAEQIPNKIATVTESTEHTNQRKLPKLETVTENYVPRAFDPIPRGPSNDHIE